MQHSKPLRLILFQLFQYFLGLQDNTNTDDVCTRDFQELRRRTSKNVSVVRYITDMQDVLPLS